MWFFLIQNLQVLLWKPLASKYHMRKHRAIPSVSGTKSLRCEHGFLAWFSTLASLKNNDKDVNFRLFNKILHFLGYYWPCSINSFAPFTEVQPQGSLCFISDEKSFSGYLTVDNTLPRIHHQTFPTHQEIERTVLQPGGGAGSPYRSGSAPRRFRALLSASAVLLPLGANTISVF